VALVLVAVAACGVDASDGATTTTETLSTSLGPASTTTGVPGPSTTGTSPEQETSTTVVPTTTHPPSSTSPLPDGWSRAWVVNVVDGDTIDIRLETGEEERVRLIGINSPEGGECYATEAADGLAGLVDGETVYLEPDVTDRDQFGRLLRYVWTTDLTLVNLIAVEEGWALAREYPPDTTRSDALDEAEERASSGGVGLWAQRACGGPIPPVVQIVHVEYDASGDDNLNQNGEWVEISNADDVPVDLTGWVLKDESATHRFSFPDGFSLQPAASVRVYTGCGADSAAALYWCVSGSAVWNNSGDTAFLLDPDGNIVYSLSYG
jgi:micrococcal nuclease